MDMTTLRESMEILDSILKKNASSLGLKKEQITQGKYGKAPETAPGLDYFINIQSVQKKVGGIATITFFYNTTHPDHLEATLKSIEGIMSLIVVLDDNQILPPKFIAEFDRMYSNIATSFLEFSFSFVWGK